jgi:hypothetical protein
VSTYGFLAFCAVYAIAVATPGPGIAALLARSLAHGMRGAAAYIAGFLVGDLTGFVGAAAGLSALAATAHQVPCECIADSSEAMLCALSGAPPRRAACSAAPASGGSRAARNR